MNLDELIRRAAALADHIAELTDQLDDAKAQLRAKIGVGKTDPSGRVRIEASRRFNAVLAEKRLPAELYDAICVPTPSTQLAKSVLTTEQLRSCQTDSTPRVVFL